MKINRHSLKEENHITALWLYEFAHGLDKNAQHLDYLKDYLDKMYKDKKFNSIEEKLADIKERVGFDLAKKIVNEIEKISNEKITTAGQSCNNSSSEKCSCEVKTAMKHSERDVKLMDNILKYISDTVEHEPHLDSATIISRCRNEDGLRFNDLRIDIGKLKDWIDKKILSNSSNNFSRDQLEEVSYIPPEPSTDGDADDKVAEYYTHAEPSPN